MYSKIICCKDCSERHIACWDTCQKYLAEKAKQREIRLNEAQDKPPIISRGQFTGNPSVFRKNKSKRRFKK